MEQWFSVGVVDVKNGRMLLKSGCRLNRLTAQRLVDILERAFRPDLYDVVCSRQSDVERVVYHGSADLEVGQ